MASLAGLTPAFRRAANVLLKVAAANGIRCTVTSTRRSRAKQARLYRDFLRGKSKFPALPPGSSLHERGLVLDMVTMPYEALWTLGKWWREQGGTWGGDEDPVHFGAPRSWW